MEETVGIIGLGYVGLPLAVAFGRVTDTIGYDLSRRKIESYRRCVDPTGELGGDELRAATRLALSDDPRDLSRASIVIVAVPTPVDAARQPDFRPLLAACAHLGPHLKKGATVVFESTVYPGATEEVCVPALEKAGGGKWKRDFFVGYSPERINPGDREHTLAKIVKVVAGDTPETLERVAALYGMVVAAGIHRAPSIAAAEAAKVLENTQRDLNIALMNELAIICHRVGIDTGDVLAAARTKWNFLDFRPGLVGGHCIGVDPYYLTHKAERLGLHPQVILAGRHINDAMGNYIAAEAVKCLASRGRQVTGARAVVLGLTFKEDCADIRNSKVIDVVRELAAFGMDVHVHDPIADAGAAQHEYGIALEAWDALPPAAILVVAVAHRAFRDCPLDTLLARLEPGGCVVDVKGIVDRAQLEARDIPLWRL